MAKQSGHIKYTGTLGDVRHFKIKGLKGHFAGLKGGVDGDRIKNDDAFERTRENMNEFGGSAKAGKYFRQVLGTVMKGVADSRVASRITALMKQINKEDGSETRGQRAILMSVRKDLLQGFEFNQGTNFDSVFRTSYALQVNDVRNHADLTIAKFNPKIHLNSPRGASHFRISFSIASVSDFVFNATDKNYEAKVKDSGLLATTYSEYTAIVQNTIDISLMADLPNAPKPTEDESLVICVGVEFYQQVGTQFYLFASGNCLTIADVK